MKFISSNKLVQTQQKETRCNSLNIRSAGFAQVVTVCHDQLTST